MPEDTVFVGEVHSKKVTANLLVRHVCLMCVLSAKAPSKKMIAGAVVIRHA